VGFKPLSSLQIYSIYQPITKLILFRTLPVEEAQPNKSNVKSILGKGIAKVKGDKDKSKTQDKPTGEC